jgi:hypothetical protein
LADAAKGDTEGLGFVPGQIGKKRLEPRRVLKDRFAILGGNVLYDGQ